MCKEPIRWGGVAEVPKSASWFSGDRVIQAPAALEGVALSCSFVTPSPLYSLSLFLLLAFHGFH